LASWYGLSEHGAKTASGEVYDLYNMTAAHASLPLHTRVRVKNLRTGKSVIVTINDRLSDNQALIKLSYYTARRLGLLNSAAPEVEIRGLKSP
jgi:rare lipoprotein A